MGTGLSQVWKRSTCAFLSKLACLFVFHLSTFYIINWAVSHSNASVDVSWMWLGCRCMRACSHVSQAAIGQSQGTALFEGGATAEARLSEGDALCRTYTLTIRFFWPNKPCLLLEVDQQSQCINWPYYDPFLETFAKIAIVNWHLLTRVLPLSLPFPTARTMVTVARQSLTSFHFTMSPSMLLWFWWMVNEWMKGLHYLFPSLMNIRKWM